MILDSFKNAELYYNLCPGMKRAFDYISKTNLAQLEVGRHTIEGDEIFVNIMETELKSSAEAKLEIHNSYADIQILLCGEREGFGWCDRADISAPLGAFDEQKDVQFFDDEHQTTYYIKRGQFTILMPDDAHAPMIGTGSVKKAIVKVRMAR